ncbi:LysR substrate-binding domain-containing protein [Myxococcus sp. 1LA]
MPLLLEYLRRHPEVRVELVSEDKPVDIVAEGFDAGVRLAGSIPRDVAAALGGAGLAYVSAWQVDDALKTGRLVQVLGDWTPAEPGVCLYYPAKRHAPASLRALVALIRERRRGLA